MNRWMTSISVRGSVNVHCLRNEKGMSNSPGYAIASQRPKGVWICNRISATQISRRPSVCLLPSPHVPTLRPAHKSLIFLLMLLSKLDYSDTGQGQKKTNQSRPYMQLHFSGLCSYRRSHPGIMHKQENLLSKLKVGSASAKNSRIPAFRLDIFQEERNAGNGSLSYKSPRGISDLSFLRHFRPNWRLRVDRWMCCHQNLHNYHQRDPSWVSWEITNNAAFVAVRAH